MSDINIDQEDIRPQSEAPKATGGAMAFVKKLPINKIVGTLLIIITGTAALGIGLVSSLGISETRAYIVGLFSEDVDEEAEAEAAEIAAADVYVKLNDIVVNLPNDGGLSVLKTKIVLKVEAQSSMIVEERQPEMMDMLQSFMRQLDSTDLQGSMGIFRIKTEILRRGNLLFDGNPITEVLLVELLAQ